MPLTALQQRFVEEYLVDLNATRASRRAGYACRIGWKVIKSPPVKAAIDAAIAERARRLEVQAFEVIDALRQIAFGAEVNPRERLAAIGLLGKHLGLFGDKPAGKPKGDPLAAFR